MFGLVSSSSPSPFRGSLPSCSLSSGRKWRASSLPEPPPASKIFIRNLSYSTGEATLIKKFSKFGHIVDVKLVKHEDTKRSKGCAFIQYSSQDDALLAIEQMDKKMIDGRLVYAEISKPVHGGFIAYPRSMGPPSKQNSEATAVRDPEG